MTRGAPSRLGLTLALAALATSCMPFCGLGMWCLSAQPTNVCGASNISGQTNGLIPCTPCRGSSDCPGGFLSACDDAGVCVECLRDADCRAEPYGDRGNFCVHGNCVQCRTDDDCVAFDAGLVVQSGVILPMPYCAIASGVIGGGLCEMCIVPSQCPADRPGCLTDSTGCGMNTNWCGNCENDVDCPRGMVCSGTDAGPLSRCAGSCLPADGGTADAGDGG